MGDEIFYENEPFSPGSSDFSWLVNQFIEIIGFLIPVIFALTLLLIIWGLTNAWIIGGGDERKVEEGKHLAVVGVIALVFMSAIWGILAILKASLFG